MRYAIAVIFALALASCAPAPMGTAPTPAQAVQTAMGSVFADARGMTLYTFDKDAPGKSNCNGECAVHWPPLIGAPTAQSSGSWSIVTRDDGSKMWAYAGKPLYTWYKDTKPGDTTGDGVGKVWHVARP